MRIAFLLDRGRTAGKVLPWYRDKAIRNLLAQIFGGELLHQLDGLIVSQFAFFRGTIQQKAVGFANDVMSGKKADSDALDEARNILETISKEQSTR